MKLVISLISFMFLLIFSGGITGKKKPVIDRKAPISTNFTATYYDYVQRIDSLNKHENNKLQELSSLNRKYSNNITNTAVLYKEVKNSYKNKPNNITDSVKYAVDTLSKVIEAPRKNWLKRQISKLKKNGN